MQTKKLLISFLGFLAIASAALAINAALENTPAAPAARAANEAQTMFEEILGDKEKSGLSQFSGRTHELASTAPGADLITSVVFYIIDLIKYLIGAIAVLYAIISGVKLIAAGKKADESFEKEKENMKMIIYGLILIITADELVTKVFFGDYGECIASASNAKECAKVGGGIVKGIYGLVLSLMATIAIFMLVLSAFKLVTAYGNEETINTQKRRLYMSIAGLLIAGVGEFVIKGIVFPEGGTKGIDIASAQNLVYTFTNFVSAFIGAASFAMMFYGGYQYVVSFGNEEGTGKAKKIILGAVIGILVALAAFAITRTVITFTDKGTDVMNKLEKEGINEIAK